MKKVLQSFAKRSWLLLVAALVANLGCSSVQADSALWGVGNDNKLYIQEADGKWAVADSQAQIYKVAPTDDSIWAIDPSGKVFYKDVSPADPTGKNSQWEQIDFEGKAVDITAAAEQVIIIDDKTDFYSRKVSASSPKGTAWTKIEEPVEVEGGFRQVNVTAPVETLESIALQKISDAAAKAYLAAIAAGKSPEEAKKAAEAAAREAALSCGLTGKEADAMISQAVTSAATSPEYAEAQLLAKAGAKGEEFVGAISATHEFYTYNQEKKKWEELAEDLGFDDLPGKAEQVDINDDGLSVAVNDVAQGFWRSSVDPEFDWVNIKERSFNQLHVNNNSMIWGIDKTNVVVAVNVTDKDKWDGSGWKEISTPKPFTSITVTDKDVWGTTAEGELYFRTGLSVENTFGTDWEQVDKDGVRVRMVAADRDGEYVWGLSLAGEILFRQGVTLTNPTGSNWEIVPGTLTSIAVTSKGEPYGIDKDGSLFTRTGITEQTPMGTGWDAILEPENVEKGEAAPLLKNIFVSEVALPLEGKESKPKVASEENKKKADKKREARKAKRKKNKKLREKKRESGKKDKKKKAKAKKSAKGKKAGKKGKKIKGAKKKGDKKGKKAGKKVGAKKGKGKGKTPGVKKAKKGKKAGKKVGAKDKKDKKGKDKKIKGAKKKGDKKGKKAGKKGKGKKKKKKKKAATAEATATSAEAPAAEVAAEPAVEAEAAAEPVAAEAEVVAEPAVEEAPAAEEPAAA